MNPYIVGAVIGSLLSGILFYLPIRWVVKKVKGYYSTPWAIGCTILLEMVLLVAGVGEVGVLHFISVLILAALYLKKDRESVLAVVGE